MDQKLKEEYKKKLLMAKSKLLNNIKSIRTELLSRDFHGDEIDQSANNLAENTYLSKIKSFRTQLQEIEQALVRIENGTFGLCRITNEPIEEKRLNALPWTDLSIEGAEILETQKKRYSI